MKNSGLMSASQYIKIRKVDFPHQDNDSIVSEKLLPLIESGTAISCSETKSAAIIASYTKKLREKTTFCKLALAFSALMWLICILNIITKKHSFSDMNTFMFFSIPPLLCILFIKLIRDRNELVRQMCSKSAVTARSYTIMDTYVCFGSDDIGDYYIMLDGFAICTHKEPVLTAARGLSISAAVIEIQNGKYFTVLK